MRERKMRERKMREIRDESELSDCHNYIQVSVVT